jgi:anaerobic ribonucleoside-triphosphate reductase activating protein
MLARMLLRVAQVVPDTEAEGPGHRAAVWVQGCSLRCAGCCNPEFFAADRGGALVETATLAASLIATPGLEGLSLLGGEPFEQPAAVADLCQRVRAAGLGVMVYSGYRIEELRALASKDVDALLASIDLLADGRFEQANPERTRRWLGSANQRLHFLSARYSPHDPRLTMPNTIELRYADGQLTINGWPGPADQFTRR